MNLEGLLSQALRAADEAANSPIGQNIKNQIGKGVAVAAAASQNLPSHEQIAQVIEEKSPALAQAFLGYASEISNPQQVGMGLKILDLNDLSISVQLPHRWRNRTENGAFHPSALLTVAEFAGRSFWERQADRGLARLELLEVKAEYHKDTFRPVTAKYNVSGEEREKILFQLRKDGEVSFETPVIVFGKGEERIAEFSLLWKMTSQFSLESSDYEVDADTPVDHKDTQSKES